MIHIWHRRLFRIARSQRLYPHLHKSTKHAIACTELEESHSCAANAASNDRNLDQIGAFRDDLHIKLNFLYKHRRSDCGIAYTRSAQLQDMIETSASSDSNKAFTVKGRRSHKWDQDDELWSKLKRPKIIARKLFFWKSRYGQFWELSFARICINGLNTSGSQNWDAELWRSLACSVMMSCRQSIWLVSYESMFIHR